MTAPDWAALVQQTRDRIDGVEKFARLHTDTWWLPDVRDYALMALRMAAWARDVLDRHPLCHFAGRRAGCARCGPGICDEVRPVLRAWVPDLLTAAGVEP